MAVSLQIPFLYSTKVVSCLDNRFPSLPELVGTISTTIRLSINKLTSSAKTLNPGAWEEIRLQLTEGELLPAAPPRDCSLGEPLWAGRNVFVPGTKCDGPNWEKGALAAQVQGSEAGLAPGMSCCWPSSSSLGKRGQLPLPGHVLQAVKLKPPPQAGPAWSGAEP